jgi:RNA polymerase sigma factor (sigma-70 family)
MKLDARTISRLRRELAAWPGAKGIARADLDDLIQETLEALLASPKKRGEFASGDELTRYATGILRNRRALMYRRQFAEERRASGKRGRADVADASPTERVSERERAEAARALIDRLSPDDRAVLWLCFRGVNLKQSAEALGISHDAARQRFSRALRVIVSAGRRRE